MEQRTRSVSSTPAKYGTAILITVSLLLCMGVIEAQQIPSEQITVVEAVPPIYPVIALSAHVEGTVVVEVHVNAEGYVVSANALSGHELLAKASENSAKRWTFGSQNKEARPRLVHLTFYFKIMPIDTSAEQLLPIFKPPYRIEIRSTVPKVTTLDSVDPPLSVKSPRPRKH